MSVRLSSEMAEEAFDSFVCRPVISQTPSVGTAGPKTVDEDLVVWEEALDGSAVSLDALDVDVVVSLNLAEALAVIILSDRTHPTSDTSLLGPEAEEAMR